MFPLCPAMYVTFCFVLNRQHRRHPYSFVLYVDMCLLTSSRILFTDTLQLLVFACIGTAREFSDPKPCLVPIYSMDATGTGPTFAVFR